MSSGSYIAEKRPAIFYGWAIVAISFILIVIAYSSRYAFSVFYVVMLDEFGWSYAATSAAMGINLIIYTMCCPIVGGFVDKFGARKVIPIGGIFLGIALVGCSQINFIWQLYILFGLTAIGTATVGIVPIIALLSNWFIRRRGLVMGIGISALGIAMTLTPFAQYLISTLGWRNAYLVFAVMAVIVIVPLAIIFVRDRPEDKGLFPDGIVERNGVADKGGEAPMMVVNREWAAKEWTVAKSVQTYQFWGLILINMLFGMYDYAIITQQVVYLVKDVGYSHMFGATVFGFFGIAMAVGGGLGGYISDKKGRETTFGISSFGCLLGLFCLLQITDTHQPWLPYIYAVLFGISSGAAGAILAPATADLFFGKHFGAINGIMTMALMGGGSLGPLASGLVRDATGSFSFAFISLFFVICAAAAMLWFVAPRKVRAMPGNKMIVSPNHC
ncbi:MAG: MFS transporter [Thermodesulfobacteriota bacterium]|nr:MFS transporter [Thermodesulfobacteriota bacterium]